jgi:hypothetical protein
MSLKADSLRMHARLQERHDQGVRSSLAAAAGIAGASPVDLGTGPGTYFFNGSRDQSFFVDLAPVHGAAPPAR